MIHFSFKIDETKARTKTVTLIQSKPYLLIGGVSLVLATYFLVIGFLVDKEALVNGFSLLWLTFLMTGVCVVRYYTYRKVIQNNFKEAENDVIEYTIDKNGETIEITGTKNRKLIEFNLNDIENIYFKKRYIVLKLKSKIFVEFPNRQNIADLLKR